MSSGVIKKFDGSTLHFAKTFCIDPEQRTAEVMKDQALEQQERFDAAARGGGGKGGKEVAAKGLLSCLDAAYGDRWAGSGNGREKNKLRGGSGKLSAVARVAGAPSRRAKERVQVHPRYAVRHMVVLGNHPQSMQIFIGTVKGQILMTTVSGWAGLGWAGLGWAGLGWVGF